MAEEDVLLLLTVFPLRSLTGALLLLLFLLSVSELSATLRRRAVAPLSLVPDAAAAMFSDERLKSSSEVVRRRRLVKYSNGLGS